MSIENISLTPSSATDIFAIYSQEGNGLRQVFKLARPTKALIRITTKPMEQPLETGATIVDHRVVLPVEIDIDLFLSSTTYRTTIDEIKQLYSNASSLVAHCRSGIYDNLFIQDMPIDESVDKFGSLTIKMKLKEVLIVTASFQPVNITNRPTVSRGNISPIPATTVQKSELGTIAHRARKPNPNLRRKS